MAAEEAVKVGRSKTVMGLICCEKNTILKCGGSH